MAPDSSLPASQSSPASSGASTKPSPVRTAQPTSCAHPRLARGSVGGGWAEDARWNSIGVGLSKATRPGGWMEGHSHSAGVSATFVPLFQYRVVKPYVYHLCAHVHLVHGPVRAGARHSQAKIKDGCCSCWFRSPRLRRCRSTPGAVSLLNSPRVVSRGRVRILNSAYAAPCRSQGCSPFVERRIFPPGAPQRDCKSQVGKQKSSLGPQVDVPPWGPKRVGAYLLY